VPSAERPTYSRILGYSLDSGFCAAGLFVYFLINGFRVQGNIGAAIIRRLYNAYRGFLYTIFFLVLSHQEPNAFFASLGSGLEH